MLEQGAPDPGKWTESATVCAVWLQLPASSCLLSSERTVFCRDSSRCFEPEHASARLETLPHLPALGAEARRGAPVDATRQSEPMRSEYSFRLVRERGVARSGPLGGVRIGLRASAPQGRDPFSRAAGVQCVAIVPALPCCTHESRRTTLQQPHLLQHGVLSEPPVSPCARAAREQVRLLIFDGALRSCERFLAACRRFQPRFG